MQGPFTDFFTAIAESIFIRRDDERYLGINNKYASITDNHEKNTIIYYGTGGMYYTACGRGN